MIIPAYQWLQKELSSDCDFCDELYIPDDMPIKFQVIAQTTSTVFTEDFTSNPYNPVEIDGTSFAFDITGLPPANTEFIIYACNKVFRVTGAALPGSEHYTSSIAGNIYYLTIDNSSGVDTFNTYLLEALNATMDVQCGTTTIYENDPLFHFVFFNMPVNSFIQDNYNVLSNFDAGLGPSGNTGSNFVYDAINKQLCYNDYIVADKNYHLSKNLIAGVQYAYTIKYNSIYSDFTLSLNVDDGTNPSTLLPFTIPATTNGTATVYFTAAISSLTEFELVLTSGGMTHSGFCVTNIAITTVEAIQSVSVANCNDVTPPVAYTKTSSGQNYLIEVTTPITGIFKISIITNLGTITSRWYERVSQSDCSKGSLIKLAWTSDCQLGDLDYYNLPFINQYLLMGSKIKQTDEKVDAVGNVTGSGKKKSIYRHTISIYELRFHPYREETQSTIHAAFAHKNIAINDEVFWLGDSEDYAVNEIEHPVYTGRVQLYKDGTELIVSSCCCAPILYSGGRGI